MLEMRMTLKASECEKVMANYDTVTLMVKGKWRTTLVGKGEYALSRRGNSQKRQEACDRARMYLRNRAKRVASNGTDTRQLHTKSSK